MLKITIHPGAGELRLRLEGRLAGPWVQELRQCWQTAALTYRCRATVLDLREVDFVDSEGQALLAQMHNKGVRLEAFGPLIQHILEEIAGAPDCARVEEISPGTPDAFVSPNPARRNPRTV
jgi:anti-anti-sigma regulatory factor